MKRLNALDWADGLCTAVFGLRIGVRVTEPEILPRLLDRFPPGWRISTTRRMQVLYSLSSVASRRRPGTLLHQLYGGKEYLTRGSDPDRVLTVMGNDLRLVLAVASPWRTFIHAGAVGWRGRAILIPGGSGAGKSTLTAALVRGGATLLSDEHAILDRRGRVHPWPAPVRIAKGEGPGKGEVSVEELGGRVARGPLPIGLILSTRYAPGGRTLLRKMSQGRAALALMAHAVQARLRPERVMESISRVAQGAMALQGPRGEADHMVDTLLKLW